MNPELPAPLRGIVVPAITPLKDFDTLDEQGLDNLIEHLIAGGVNGIFILGTTGEGTSLSYTLRKEVIRKTCSKVNGRLPVLVGITDTAFMESVTVAKMAQDAGAQGVVVAHPPYFPAADPEILNYLEHLAKEVPLPIFLYNMPSHTKLTFAPQTVRDAADIDGIVGLKDSSANLLYLHKIQMLLKQKPDFTFLVGPEELLPETVMMGGHGGVNGGANICPELYVNLYKASAERDFDKIKQLHDKVMQISMTIYSVGAYSSYLRGLKCAVSCVGICSDGMAEPFRPFDKEEKNTVARYVDELGLKK